jgi:hypothetical protein
MRLQKLTVILPLFSASLLAVPMWRAGFMDLTVHNSLFYLIVTFFPFLLLSLFEVFRTPSVTALPCSLVLNLILSVPAIACMTDNLGEGCGYILALSFMYLWPVTLIGLGLCEIVNHAWHRYVSIDR